MLLTRGTVSSPISIATTATRSTPSPTPSSSSSSSSSAASFHTPPEALGRPRAILSPLSAPRSPSSPRSKPTASSARPLHPFFVRRKAPPTPSKPRFVAHYTSSETGSSHGGSPSAISDSDVDDLSQSMAALDVHQGQLPRNVPRPKPSGNSKPHSDDMFWLSPSDRIIDPPSDVSAIRRFSRIVEADEKNKAKLESRRNGSAQDLVPRKPRPVSQAEAYCRKLREDKAKAKKDAQAGIQAQLEPPEPEQALPMFSLNNPLEGHFSTSPKIVYTRDASEADDLISCLRGPLGFDMEWPRWAKEWDKAADRWVYKQGRTAVVQVADERMVVVYHLCDKGHLGPGMRALLSDARRFKVGVNIVGDGMKLVRDGLVETPPEGLVELSRLAKAVDEWGSHRLVALARLARRYLGVELDKDDQVRSGEWDKSLEQKQIEYAANDAFASLLIHKALSSRLEAEEVGRLVTKVTVPTAPEARDDGKKAIKPYIQRAYDLFVGGMDFPELAEKLSIKEISAHEYVLVAAAAQEVISPTDVDRILAQIPLDSWAGKRNGSFLLQLKDNV